MLWGRERLSGVLTSTRQIPSRDTEELSIQSARKASSRVPIKKPMSALAYPPMPNSSNVLQPLL